MIKLYTGLLFLLLDETVPAEGLLSTLSAVLGSCLILRGSKELRDLSPRFRLSANAAGIFLFWLAVSVIFQRFAPLFFDEIHQHLLSWILTAALAICDAALLWATAEICTDLFPSLNQLFLTVAYSCGFARLLGTLLSPIAVIKNWLYWVALSLGVIVLMLLGWQLRKSYKANST